jgi:hypothetical protein
MTTKLNEFQKIDRKILKADLKMDKGGLFHSAMEGITVCIRPVFAITDAKFCRVSVATCDMETDTFKRKVGEFLALERMYEKEQFITIATMGRSYESIAYDTIALMSWQ